MDQTDLQSDIRGNYEMDIKPNFDFFPRIEILECEFA